MRVWQKMNAFNATLFLPLTKEKTIMDKDNTIDIIGSKY